KQFPGGICTNRISVAWLRLQLWSSRQAILRRQRAGGQPRSSASGERGCKNDRLPVCAWAAGLDRQTLTAPQRAPCSNVTAMEAGLLGTRTNIAPERPRVQPEATLGFFRDRIAAVAAAVELLPGQTNLDALHPQHRGIPLFACIRRTTIGDVDLA